MQSCDFAPAGSVPGLPEEGSYLLATAGADSLVKLWRVDVDEVNSISLESYMTIVTHLPSSQEKLYQAIVYLMTDKLFHGSWSHH